MSTPRLLTKLFTDNGLGNKLNSDLLPETETVTKVSQLENDSNFITQSTAVNPTGSRGALAGYETTGAYTATINSSSPDTSDATGNVTVSDGAAGTTWTKLVRLTDASYTVTLGSGWAWQGGSAPTISANGVLVLNWINTTGVASFVSREA